jgi:hypothetical protein
MKHFLLFVSMFLASIVGRTQVVLNEVYTDPGSGKHEFFELFNYGPSTSTDNMTLVTFFDSAGTKGFYVLDVPNFTIGFQQYFVGAAALPFNYQGVTGSTAAQFSWNNVATLTATGGYLKNWVLGTANLIDGNANYDEQAIPANFNDFFYHCSGGSDPSFSVFLYKNGVLVNTLFGGMSGVTGAPACITAMPSLFVDMSGASPDFTINFPAYGSIKSEWYVANTGSDNGYTRTKDALCKQWQKAAAGVAHTPGYTNGSPIGIGGELTISAGIVRKTAPGDSSYMNYNITAGPVEAFPVDLISYFDNGVVANDIDFADQYLTTKTENTVADGPFQTKFMPQNPQLILMAQSSAGCLDQVLIVPNNPPIALPVKLIVFQGNLNSNKVTLQWIVGQNETAERFEVERSFDGINFTTAALVFTTGKTGSENYMFYENLTNSGKVYYRLKMYDKSQAINYSKILAFQTTASKSNEIKILNNPVTDKLTFSFQSDISQQVMVKIIDMQGRVQIKQTLNGFQGSNMVSFPLISAFPAGTYVVKVSMGAETLTSKFVKQ